MLTGCCPADGNKPFFPGNENIRTKKYIAYPTWIATARTKSQNKTISQQRNTDKLIPEPLTIYH